MRRQADRRPLRAGRARRHDAQGPERGGRVQLGQRALRRVEVVGQQRRPRELEERARILGQAGVQREGLHHRPRPAGASLCQRQLAPHHRVERRERQRPLQHRHGRLGLLLAQELAAQLEEALRVVGRVGGAIEELRRLVLAAQPENVTRQVEELERIRIAPQARLERAPRRTRALAVEQRAHPRLELAPRALATPQAENAVEPAHRGWTMARGAPRSRGGGRGIELRHFVAYLPEVRSTPRTTQNTRCQRRSGRERWSSPSRRYSPSLGPRGGPRPARTARGGARATTHLRIRPRGSPRSGDAVGLSSPSGARGLHPRCPRPPNDCRVAPP